MRCARGGGELLAPAAVHCSLNNKMQSRLSLWAAPSQVNQA